MKSILRSIVAALLVSPAVAETAWLNPETRDEAWTDPGPVVIDGQTYWRPAPETLQAAGYCPVEYDPDWPWAERVVDWGPPPTVRRMTEEELQAAHEQAVQAAVAAEEARIAGKPLELKKAENSFLSAVGAFNSVYASGDNSILTITAADGFTQIYAKIDASTMSDTDKLKTGMRLQALWDVVLYWGGRFGDVQWHDDAVE